MGRHQLYMEQLVRDVGLQQFTLVKKKLHRRKCDVFHPGLEPPSTVSLLLMGA